VLLVAERPRGGGPVRSFQSQRCVLRFIDSFSQSRVSHLAQLPRTTGKHLATGSGDTTVRFYDLDKELPAQQCKGHSNWVLCVSWAPDGTMVASGGMDGEVRVCLSEMQLGMRK
jgi:WD40 repeat protein